MIWVIGDIHGMHDPLKGLLSAMRLAEEPDDPIKKIIFVGDYIDHGPSSKEVIDLVSRLDFETVLLAGNHEDMAIRFIKNDRPFHKIYGDSWSENGARDTYLSLCDGRASARKARAFYFMNPDRVRKDPRPYLGREIPRRYERFLTSLRYTHQEVINAGGRRIPFFFAHALPCQDDSLALQRQATWRELNAYMLDQARRAPSWSRPADKEKLIELSRINVVKSYLWGREYNFLGYEGEVVVHGHTPTVSYRDRYRLSSSEEPFEPQFKEYDPQSLAPFFFSRSPGARYESFPPQEARRELMSLGAGPAWLGSDLAAAAYPTTGELGVEAINIDTGCVVGGGLTALGLSEKYLEGGWLLSMVYEMGGDHRAKKEKVAKRAIKISRLGGVEGPVQRPADDE
jgi:hypothetical protein